MHLNDFVYVLQYVDLKSAYWRLDVPFQRQERRSKASGGPSLEPGCYVVPQIQAQ